MESAETAPVVPESRRALWPGRLKRVALVLLGAPLILSLAYSVLPPPVTGVMLWKALHGYGIDYRWVPLSQISPNLPNAVLAAEDDHVLIRFTVTAVHRKDYRGIPATGKPMTDLTGNCVRLQ